MSKKSGLRKRKFDLAGCRLLGKGHNGAVYLLKTGEVIKISFNEKSFIGEYSILQRVNGNKYFPRIYEVGANYMIRECVDGDALPEYIKKNGFDEKLACRIVDLLKEFEKLGFAKIDIRCKDIFVQPDGRLKVIDPKGFYTKERDFPRHLSKGLYKMRLLDFFMDVLKRHDKDSYLKWNEEINNYIYGKSEQ